MAHTELDLRERRAIEDMLNAKVPVSQIAAEIGRHRSSIYREIKRNYFTDEELPHLNGYYGMNAQKYASAPPCSQTQADPPRWSAYRCHRSAKGRLDTGTDFGPSRIRWPARSGQP